MRLSTSAGPIDATFGVELVDGEVTVTFDSRSGKRGAASARNSDYERGLEVVLDRLAALGASIKRVALHPANGREGSQLRPEGYSFPLALAAVADTQRLRLALSRAQAQADREPGAKGGGNPTKRIRIYLDLASNSSAEVLGKQLATGQGLAPAPAYLPTVDDALEAIAAADRAPPAKGRKGPVRLGKSQGFGLTGPERRAVERRAMAVATEYFESPGQGWRVKDVGEDESYDLACRKGGLELHVEVKGTTGLGEQVILTRNEVEHARTYPYVALAVVSGIRLVKGTPPVAEGGQLKVRRPWKINEAALEAMAFYYDVARTT